MQYQVHLGFFEGPIDLLLHLITRRRVDIYDVSLATLTDEYLAATAEMADLDLEAATGFLVVAATLLELKSARLLPTHRADGSDDGLLEERDRLLARLVEVATYTEAGSWLGRALEANAGFHPRETALEAPFAALAPELPIRITAEDLVSAALRALGPTVEPPVDLSHVAPLRASVRDAIVDVAERLRSGGAVSFGDLCAGSRERVDVVVRFLALLELFKTGAVEIVQHERFGDIEATWTGEMEPEQVLEGADEYAVEGGVAKR